MLFVGFGDRREAEHFPRLQAENVADEVVLVHMRKKDFIIGLNLAPLTAARRELLEIPPDVSGVIVLSIDDDSMFLGFGIRPGDVIESVNQQPVTSPGEATVRLKRALASEQNNVLMLINRYGTNRYLAMSLENEPNGRDDG